MPAVAKMFTDSARPDVMLGVLGADAILHVHLNFRISRDVQITDIRERRHYAALLESNNRNALAMLPRYRSKLRHISMLYRNRSDGASIQTCKLPLQNHRPAIVSEPAFSHL